MEINCSNGQWLAATEHTVTIIMEADHFIVHAIDTKNGMKFCGEGHPLCNALANKIFIARSALRTV